MDAEIAAAEIDATIVMWGRIEKQNYAFWFGFTRNRSYTCLAGIFAAGGTVLPNCNDPGDL